MLIARLSGRISFTPVISIFVLSLLLFACADPAQFPADARNKGSALKYLESAHWDQQEKRLTVSGKSPVNGIFVEITDTQTGKRLGLAPVKNNRWFFTSEALNTSPCNIIARVQTTRESIVVNENDCIGSGSLGARTLRPLVNSITANAIAPAGVIIEPATDLTVTAGTAIDFRASGTDTSNSLPLSFLWQFAGNSPNLLVQNPGPLVFNRPGVHRVSLTVINALGIPDPTPAIRTIRVLPPQGVLNTPPVASIDAPAGDLIINVGDTITFSGSATHPGPAADLSYLWQFSGAAPTSTVQSPGNVTFNRAGTFLITLTVTDAAGLQNTNIAEVSITVVDNGSNQAPTGLIISPNTDVIIQPDSSVFFAATATDPDNNTPISYLWNFDGVVPNSSVQNPGSIVFPTPGIYSISMTATDSQGLADPAPPMRTVTVEGASVVNEDTPESMILMPSADMTIEANPAGDTLVAFEGQGTSPTGNDPVNLEWAVDGIPLADMSPMVDIALPGVGTYTITLTAIDALGQRDPTPAQRVISVIDSVAGAPDSEIDSPSHGETTIVAGESVTFIGEAEKAVGLEPLSYLWTFDGALPDSTEMSPGALVFDMPGTYVVTFTVFAADGTPDPTPDSHTIIVEEAPAPPVAPEPDGIILSPETDVEISAGDSVNFSGKGMSEDLNASFLYSWDFGGIATSDLMEPGLIAFPDPGVYVVTLMVSDANTGITDSSPATRTITVLDPAGPAPDPLALRPTATILSPDGDVTIQVGDAVEFLGEGADPAGGELMYEWSFGTAAPDANVQNPGIMTFNEAGVFKVKLEVTSSVTGLHADPDPMITVTVEPAPAPAP